MELGELLTEWRRRLDDSVGPQYLWSDADGIAYANQAEREACERAKLIFDTSTPQICHINGLANVATYTLDSRIIEVKAVKWDHRFLLPRSREELNDGWRGGCCSRGGGWPGWYSAIDWSGATDWSTLTGSPDFFIDPQEKYLTLVRIPHEAKSIDLEVYRYPLDPMQAPSDEPEIAERHQYNLIVWMEALAYNKHDTECFDAKLRDEKKAEFDRLFGIKLDANVQRQQRARRRNHTLMNPAW